MADGDSDLEKMEEKKFNRDAQQDLDAMRERVRVMYEDYVEKREIEIAREIARKEGKRWTFNVNFLYFNSIKHYLWNLHWLYTFGHCKSFCFSYRCFNCFSVWSSVSWLGKTSTQILVYSK